MPGGEELIIADRRVKIRKNGEEQFLEETSPKPPTEIDEYLDEFRIIKTDEKVLPNINGDEDNQLTTILGKLKVIRNSNAFEYYYLLGKLIEEYPATMKKKIHQKSQHNYNKRIRAIVAERLQTSLLWDDILNNLTFSISQELNAGAE
ncbi:11508_t:CDS:2, partial [Entrophospora sp. SA101]